jgi:hypothetical protein
MRKRIGIIAAVAAFVIAAVLGERRRRDPKR